LCVVEPGLLKSAAKAAPTNRRIFTAIADSYAADGELATAQFYLERAVYLVPTDVGTRLKIGMIANNQGDKEAAIKGFSGCLTALKPQLLQAFWSGEDPARLEHIKRLAAEGLAQLAPDVLAEHEPKKQGQCMDQKAAEQRAKEEAVVEVVQKVTSTDGSTREKHLAKLHKRLKGDSSLLNCRGLAKPGMLSFLPPLHLAVFHNDTALCKILLEHGADPGYRYYTLLYYTHALLYS
jgi:hypothetical protein